MAIPRTRRAKPVRRRPQRGVRGGRPARGKATSVAGAGPRPRGLLALAGTWAGDASLDVDLAALYASRALPLR